MPPRRSGVAIVALLSRRYHRLPRIATAYSLGAILTDPELARLDQLRPAGTSRPAFLRSLLREPPMGQEVANRTEALAILAALARDGRVAAAIALERATREEGPVDDALDDILRSSA
jgi:hypothetical protein